MLTFLRNLVAPKVGLKLMIRGRLDHHSFFMLQKVVQSFSPLGWMQIEKGQALIELEGPRPKLEAILARLQKTPIPGGPIVLEATWLPNKKQFTTFRVAV